MIGEGEEGALAVIHNAATTNKEGGKEGTRGQTGSRFSSCEYCGAAEEIALEVMMDILVGVSDEMKERRGRGDRRNDGGGRERGGDGGGVTF